MALIACVSTVVSCICQPVMDSLLSSLREAAQDLFSCLRNWAAGEIGSRFSSWRNAVVEVPVSSASLVGAEETLEEIRSCFKDDSVGIVGIYGMGGVGKTTLLKRINNDFFESGTRGMFDLVIWVTVSSEINVAGIQKQIGDRVGLSFSASESADGSSSSQVDEQARLLFQALSKKRFLLLFDDLWEKLDLIKVGIPLPESRRHCKIVFTTRLLTVCSDMDADKNVTVKLLDKAQSWELFCTKVRTAAALKNPSVQRLAKLVVAKCGGLPLALVAVGRAMATKILPDEWKHAVKALDECAEKLRGMDKVLSSLKFSYDNLPNDTMRSALLYCAMYPEDFDISRAELVEYWVGEGLLDDDDDGDDELDDARNRGHVLISDLQSACLLEAGTSDAERQVKMHDAVRDMVLWLNSHECDKVNGFLVFVEGKWTQVTKMPRREHVRRIWMRELNLELFPLRMPNCPNAWTLLLNATPLGPSVLQGLLEIMRTLRVLDLSLTRLKEVPKEVGSLVELQYLNLSQTEIMSLPKELGNLIRLRQLVLNFMYDLRVVPWESIARLSHLQVLNMWISGYNWDHGERTCIQTMEEEGGHQQHSPLVANAFGGVGRQVELRDLEELRQLQELWIDIHTSHALERLLGSNMLCRCIRRLRLIRTGDWDIDDPFYGEGGALLQKAFQRMSGHPRMLEICEDRTHPFVGELRFNLHDLRCLEELLLFGFDNDLKVVVEGCSRSLASSYVPSLRLLNIQGSHGFKALILVGRFPCLEQIFFCGCKGMEELVLGDDDGVRTSGGRSIDSDFPMLKRMDLQKLTGLRSISRQTLFLPSLEVIWVWDCPQLRQLPLGPGSVPKLKEIHGEQEWWDALQWDASDTGSDGTGSNAKDTFTPCFRRY